MLAKQVIIGVYFDRMNLIQCYNKLIKCTGIYSIFILDMSTFLEVLKQNIRFISHTNRGHSTDHPSLRPNTTLTGLGLQMAQIYSNPRQIAFFCTLEHARKIKTPVILFRFAVSMNTVNSEQRF